MSRRKANNYQRIIFLKKKRKINYLFLSKNSAPDILNCIKYECYFNYCQVHYTTWLRQMRLIPFDVKVGTHELNKFFETMVYPTCEKVLSRVMSSLNFRGLFVSPLLTGHDIREIRPAHVIHQAT